MSLPLGMEIPKDMSASMKHALELAVVGGFLNERFRMDDLRDMANRYGLIRGTFDDPVLGLAFETAMKLDSEDTTLLLVALQKAGVTGDVIEAAVAKMALVIVDCDAHMRELMNRAVSKGIDKALAETRSMPNYGDDELEALQAKLDECKARIKGKGGGANAKSAKDILESVDDQAIEENRLFAGDQNFWLSKGGSLVLVSGTGSGKSVLTMQLALSWAGGQPIFGFVPARPLKIAIFQTEDDDNILKRNLKSFKRLCGWSGESFDEALERVVFIDPKGLSNQAFIDYMASEQRKGAYDIIIINPLQAFTAGLEIKDNAKLGEFLRHGIDSVAKGVRRNCPKCAVVIVHHTNKPVVQNGATVFPSLEYIGAGGAELPNWARSVLVLMEETGRMARKGHYRLVGAKNGTEFGWTEVVCGRPACTIRHHDKEIDGEEERYWHEAEPAAGGPQAAQKPKGPTEDDVKRLADAVKGCKRPPTLTEARKMSADMFGRQGNKAFDKLKTDLAKYGLEEKPGDTLAQKILVGIG